MFYYIYDIIFIFVLHIKDTSVDFHQLVRYYRDNFINKTHQTSLINTWATQLPCKKSVHTDRRDSTTDIPTIIANR